MGFHLIKTIHTIFSRVQFGSSLFQDSEEIIHSAEINDTSYEWAGCFHWDEAKENIFFLKKKKFEIADSKNPYFPAPSILNISS